MREDGRQPTQQRTFTLAQGTLQRADGSARVSLGPTTLLASFSGPIEVRIRDERLDRATLEVSHRPLDGVSGLSSKTLSTLVETSLLPLLNLSAHPRSLVLLTIQSLSAPPLPIFPNPPSQTSFEPVHSNRSVRSPSTTEKALSITAGSLAVMDAGSIGMLALAVGASCAFVEGLGWVVDPSFEEEKKALAVFGVAYAFGASVGQKDEDHSVVWFEGEGSFDEDDISTALAMTLSSARETHSEIRASFQSSLAPGDAMDL